MVARFEKAKNSLGEVAFDGFDPKTFYQMVPVGERRGELSVISEGEEIAVAFDPPKIARFGNRSFNPHRHFLSATISRAFRHIRWSNLSWSGRRQGIPR